MSMILINESLDLTTIKTVCKYLKKGYAVLVKTDTQWGIMSLRPQLIYQIKKRPLDKKLVRFVNGNFRFSNLSLQQRKFINHFWPGSVTIIKDGESFRLTNRRIINLILAVLNQPVYCSSANVSGGDPIQSIDDALTVFSHASNRMVGLIPVHNYKQKEWEDNVPSTIVDIDYWYIVRKGTRYEEVLDYIANKIIPSYDKQQQYFENRLKRTFFKVPMKYTRNYYGIPVIDLVPGLALNVRKKNVKQLIKQYQQEEQRELMLEKQAQAKQSQNQIETKQTKSSSKKKKKNKETKKK